MSVIAKRIRRAVMAGVIVSLGAACSPTAASPSPSATAAASPTPSQAAASASAAAASPTTALSDISAAEIKDAALATVATGSSSLLFSIEFNGSTKIPEGTSIKASGSTNFGSSREQTLSMDMDDLGLGVLEYQATGSDLYMRGDMIKALTKDASTWLHVDLASKSEASAQFSALVSGENDASLIVYYLLGAKGDIRALGSETLDGVSTDRLGVELDLYLALADVPAEAKDALVANIAEQQANGIKDNLPAEVWIGDDGLVRRVSYTYQLTSQAGGGAMTAVVDLGEFGVPVKVHVPAESDVVHLDDIAP